MDGDPSCVFEALLRVSCDNLAMSNRRAGGVYGIPSEAPALPTAVLTLRRRSGSPRSCARSSGQFRRLQSWASTMRKLLTWGYVTADSANRGGELKKRPEPRKDVKFGPVFLRNGPEPGGVTALERSGVQAAGSWQQAAGSKRPAGRRAQAPAPPSPLSPRLAPLSPPLRQLILFPTGSIAIYWETAAALGLRER